MRNLLVFLLLTGCASTAPKSGVLAPQCGKTPVVEDDFTRYGFTTEPGKIVVMHIFASWCPYCKTDLSKMAALYKSGEWSADTVKLFLLAYHNHDENQKSFDEFKEKGIKEFGFPKGAVQMVFVDQEFVDLSKSQSASGQNLFTGWSGIPFGLVFGKDGRLAFRGHFTMSDGYEETHYKFITGLQQETCKN